MQTGTYIVVSGGTLRMATQLVSSRRRCCCFPGPGERGSSSFSRFAKLLPSRTSIDLDADTHTHTFDCQILGLRWFQPDDKRAPFVGNRR